MKIASECPEVMAYDLPMITSSLLAPSASVSRGDLPAISLRLSSSTVKSQGWFPCKNAAPCGTLTWAATAVVRQCSPKPWCCRGEHSVRLKTGIGTSYVYFYLVFLGFIFESRRGMDWRSLGSPAVWVGGDGLA
jgi:hypothetical protein